MFNVKRFIQQCVLALSLGCAATLAQADPILYHVSVDTAGLGTDGSLDVGVGSTNGAPTLLASLSNFSAGFTGINMDVTGVYSNTPNGYSLTNSKEFNYLSQFVTFGGKLSFDVLFSGPFFDVASTEATLFSVQLYDNAGAFIGDVVSFDFATSGANRITLTQGLGTAVLQGTAAVPEPGVLLMMLLGLALMATMARRRAR